MTERQDDEVARLEAEIKPLGDELERLKGLLKSRSGAEADAIVRQVAELQASLEPLLKAYVDAISSPYQAQIDTVDEGALEAHRLAQLELLHRAWELRERNPIYVWEALDYCADDKPIPKWILDYFKKCWKELKLLTFSSNNSETKSLTSADAIQQFYQSLDFRREPNWNAIERRRQDNTDAEAALEVTLRMSSRGMKLCRARGATAKRRAVKARQVREIMKRASKLWEK